MRCVTKSLISHMSNLLRGLLVLVYTVPSMILAMLFLVFPRPRKNIKNEIVLITGSGQGLGRELAFLFAHQCCEVVCVDIDAENNEATASEIVALGGIARAYVCNVADREAVVKLAKEVGRVDILVNNAGIYPLKNLWNSTEKELKMIVDVNLFSQIWTIQAFLPGMKERDHGHIVCISSVASLLGVSSLLAYSMSKAGLSGLMLSLAQELKEENKNINCTTAYPFFLKTRSEISECVTSRIPPVAAQQAAKEIVTGVMENLDYITVPRSFETVVNLCRILPKNFKDTLFYFFPVTITAPKIDKFKELMDKEHLKKSGRFTAQERK